MPFVPFAEVKATTANRRMRRHAGSLIRILEAGWIGDPNLSGVEWIVRRGNEPPRHQHEREDEAVFVVAGDVEFQVGQRRVEIGQGNWLFLPRGVAHSFRVLSDQVHMLAMYAPGGIETFFEALSEPVTSEDGAAQPPLQNPFERESARELARQYGLSFAPTWSAVAASAVI